uniref:Uncharacterized protein n=1 Tax=Ixodes ricinus TaxID=34613 RepID=V5HEP6_IXORI
MMNAVNLRFEQIPEVNVKLMLREVKILEKDNEDDWAKVAMGNTLDSSVTLDKLEERAVAGDPLTMGAATRLTSYEGGTASPHQVVIQWKVNPTLATPAGITSFLWVETFQAPFQESRLCVTNLVIH